MGFAANDPFCRNCATHRIAELTPISKVAAASWQEAPASTARTTRLRKSCEYGFGIVSMRGSFLDHSLQGGLKDLLVESGQKGFGRTDTGEGLVQ